MTQRASPLVLLALFGLLAASSQAFWSGDDSKYIKKFAMMKVYESCFGDEVVREVRDEMRSAAARCAAAAMSSTPGSTAPTTTAPDHAETEEAATVRPQRPYHESTRRPVAASSPNLSAESLLRLQALLQGLRTQGGANLAAGGGLSSFPAAPQQPQQHYRPGAYPGAYPEMHPPAFNPAGPGYGGGYGAAPPSPYYYPHMPSPYYPHYHPYSAYMQRSSRDIRGGPVRIRNVTCVMQELGYLDANLEPNYAGIVSRIERLPLPIELRTDMSDAVHFCQKFSQCVPEPDQDKMQVSSEFTKPMIFFRCYKQKKLEACVLKDVRERFMSQGTSGSGSEDPEIPDHNGIDEDEAEAAGVLRGAFRGRSGRAMSSTQPGPGADLADLVLNEDSFAL